MSFADLGLSDSLLRAVEDSGYNDPTPIQTQAIPSVLMGKDIIGIAQTGTGKTASFVLPMIDILAEGRSRARMPRSLILEPTRELAVQVAENFEKYGKYHKLNMALLIGGVSMGDQMAALEKGVDVLIATPGRLKDLFERGKILLTGCSLLVIDEADRMLDMGFIPDIEEICSKLPSNRQTLLFSATMPPPIKKLADKFLSSPKSIEVARPATANIMITQKLAYTQPRKKRDVLRQLIKSENVQTAIVFCNRKTTVRELTESLLRYGISAGQIHGDMDQPQRLKELDKFKSGDINILVASDVAARGLDVKGVSHVFNFDVPWHPDDYIHRIGRTGRGGASGTAFSIVTDSDQEAIEAIEKLIGGPIPRLEGMEQGAAADGDSDTREEKPRGRKPKAETARPAREKPVKAERVKAERVEASEQVEPAERPARVEPRHSEQVDAPVSAAAAERPARAPRRKPRDEREPRVATENHQPVGFGGTARYPAPQGIQPVDDRSSPGDWSGPIPGFLNIGIPR
jgi:superfamily II DNA/RNA helicase